METDVAFVVVHDSVDDCPVVIDGGAALNVTDGAGVTVTVAVFVT